MLVFYQNVNRIRSKQKLDDVFLNILNCNYDIICLTETNFNDSIFDGEFIDDRYNVIRRDRYTTNVRKNDGGGALLAIKTDINFTRKCSWESKLEDIWIRIEPKCKNNKIINICLCYLPSHLSNVEMCEFYHNFQRVMLQKSDCEEYLCIGDFNTPFINWSKSTDSIIMLPDEPRGQRAELLTENMTICGLYQFNNIPNRYGKFLDLVLSTSKFLEVYGSEPLSKLDRYHPSLVIDITSLSIMVEPVKQFKPRKERRLNFNKSNYADICSDLNNVDWHYTLNSQDIDTMVSQFYNTFNDILAKHTPLTKPMSGDLPAWFSPGLRRSLVEKQKYHHRYKKFKNPRDYDTYSMLRQRCKRLIDHDYDTFLKSVEASIEGNNIKHFWRYVNSKKGSNSIPSTMSFGGKTTSDQKEICDLFSSYFSSVFVPIDSTSDNTSTLHVVNPSVGHTSASISINNVISNISITRADILRKINKLDVNKGAGPDKIPPFVIKNCRKSLCTPLLIIFNTSLRLSIFPTQWKTAHIVPVFKSGDKSRCDNYRPISILSCLAKLFESLVYDVLYFHIYPILSTRQHGFIRNRSTTSNLLEYKNYLCSAFAKRIQVDSIYTDFSKAFDKISHKILIIKLSNHYGIHGNLLRWVESYLSRRNQLVTLRGFLSAPANITSGVPQGSHLGPLLFISFINDLISNLQSPCLLYADDLKVYSAIKSTQDSEILQTDLSMIDNWCRNNQMFLNIKKCCIISFTTKHNKIIYDYKLNNHILERKSVVKDLGVYFDEKLTFREHYDYIIDRGNKLLGFISRTSKSFKNPYCLLTLYFSLVRSVLEYNSVIWSPYYKVHINRIERVQSKCLNMLFFRLGWNRKVRSYVNRLKRIKLTSLEDRRKYSDYINLFKIIHAQIDSPSLLSCININININPNSRRPQNIFSLSVYKNNTSLYNPLVRMCRQYNGLLANHHQSLDVFNCVLSTFKRNVLAILMQSSE